MLNSSIVKKAKDTTNKTLTLWGIIAEDIKGKVEKKAIILENTRATATAWSGVIKTIYFTI